MREMREMRMRDERRGRRKKEKEKRRKNIPFLLLSFTRSCAKRKGREGNFITEIFPRLHVYNRQC
jgi:hypothetical protein